MLKDLKYGARMLLHAKGWTAVVVVSLALGIGANTAIFSAVNGMLLAKIPVQEPDTLVRLRFVGRNQMSTSSSDYGYTRRTGTENVRTTFSYPMYQQFRKDNQTMADVFACAPVGRVNVVVNGNAELATAFLASGNYFQVLGINARLGRIFLPEDDTPMAPPVAVISERFWRARFGSDPSVVGKVVAANTVQVTIVGVIPASFTGIQLPVGEPPDITLPVNLDPQIFPAQPPIKGVAVARLSQPTFWWLQVMGRLKPGVTAAQVEGNLAGVFQATAKAGLDSYLAALDEPARNTANNRNRTAIPNLRVESGARGVYDVTDTDLRSVSILTGVVALVLLIVCANVANLLLSRATARQKEISVRLSMGATRGRLIRQLIVESLLLSSIGGAVGIAVGYWGKRLLPGLPGQPVPLDWRILAFVVVVTAVTGVLFGIAPALRATRADVNSVLKETSRSVVSSRSFLGKALLVVQVAISLVLLTGAGLFLRTLNNLRSVDVGFNTRNLVLFRIDPRLNGYDEQRGAQLYYDLLERLRGVPGAQGATLSNPALLSGSVNQTSIFLQSRTYEIGAQPDSINRLVVAPNFFEVMGIPIKLGRGFTENENNAKAPKVAIINEAAAKKYFPDVNPIGQRFGSSVETANQLEVVAIVRDAKYDSVRDEVPTTMYVPYRQSRMNAPTFEVRTAGDPLNSVSAIREVVRQLDPNVPMVDVSTQMEQVERRFVQEKVFAQAYTLFGVLALVIAAVGLFGVMSYNVARRTNEIGIRLALGAPRELVLRATMRESLVLVIGGVVMGIAVVLGASRFVASLLYGVPQNDTVSIALAIAVMVTVATCAAYLPARRASRVDPMVALRYE